MRLFKQKNLLLALGSAGVLLLFCFFQFSAPLFKMNPVAMQQPAWMREQIQEDLAPFMEKGVATEDLDCVMQKASVNEGLFRVKIQAGKVSFSPDFQFPGSIRTRAKHVKNFFGSLVKFYRLPDVDLILCLSDALDEREPPLVPLFVFAKRDSSIHNVLIPDFEALNPDKRLARYKQAADEHPWSKKQEVIFWRGATTGGVYELGNYLQFPRVKLVFLSKEHPEKVDAAFSVLSQGAPAALEAILRLSRPLAPYIGIPEHFAYKYLIDVDGNSCTYERCRWILLSNSTLLKPLSHNKQWYYKALQPYVHYVPLKEDLSDLLVVCDWLKQHDEEAKKIADEGRNLGAALFSKEAIREYFVALICEYSRLQKSF